MTTHHVRQSRLAQFVFVPFNTGYHLAHHVDIGVPFSKLPALQRALEQAGYIQPELEWPSYRALWRHGFGHRRGSGGDADQAGVPASSQR